MSPFIKHNPFLSLFTNHNELDPRALSCLFVGYHTKEKGYKYYHTKSRHVYITVDVTFHKT